MPRPCCKARKHALKRRTIAVQNTCVRPLYYSISSNKRMIHCWSLKHVCTSFLLFLTNERCPCCGLKFVCTALLLVLTNDRCHRCGLKHVCASLILTVPLLQPKTRVCVPSIISNKGTIPPLLPKNTCVRPFY